MLSCKPYLHTYMLSCLQKGRIIERWRRDDGKGHRISLHTYARELALKTVDIVEEKLGLPYDSHPTVGVAVFAPKHPWAIEFLM